MTPLSMQNLRPASGSRTRSKRLGRGNASGKGTTAGKGTKGQAARAGGRKRLKLIGMKRLIQSTPKLRGFRSLKAGAVAVNVGDLQQAFNSGDTVSRKSLVRKGLAPAAAQQVKILGVGKLKKKLKIIGCQVSAAAKKQILDAGGEIS